MKKKDVLVLIPFVVLIVLALLPGNIEAFKNWTQRWPYLSSFLKFSVLATFGESLALRLKTGAYTRPGFGLACRALAWGLLGMFIFVSFAIFSNGAPSVLRTLGMAQVPDLAGPFSLSLVPVAFIISLTMNLIQAPVLMVLHKISDNHIAHTGGSLRRYLSTRLDMAASFREIDWNVMWGFVFKKTIPLFWIPAHTITFLLPPYLRVLFAAALGTVLGVFLSLAAQSAHQGQGGAKAARAESAAGV
jgi:hypothetical protein